MEVYEILKIVEGDLNTQLARLMILIDDLCGVQHNKKIDGINKLAKLDFLLKSPSYLKKGLTKLRTNITINIESFELDSIESKTNLYRYIPWDENYRKILNIIIARDLVNISFEKDDYFIQISHKGILIAEELKQDRYFKEFVNRSKIISTHFGSYSEGFLNSFFEKYFPEIGSFKISNNEDLF